MYILFLVFYIHIFNVSYESNKLRDKEAELEAEEKAVQAIVVEHDAICKELAETKLKFTAFERQDIKMREDIKYYEKKNLLRLFFFLYFYFVSFLSHVFTSHSHKYMTPSSTTSLSPPPGITREQSRSSQPPLKPRKLKWWS
jgi:hypothetical protein